MKTRNQRLHREETDWSVVMVNLREGSSIEQKAAMIELRRLHRRSLGRKLAPISAADREDLFQELLVRIVKHLSLEVVDGRGGRPCSRACDPR